MCDLTNIFDQAIALLIIVVFLVFALLIYISAKPYCCKGTGKLDVDEVILQSPILDRQLVSHVTLTFCRLTLTLSAHMQSALSTQYSVNIN